VLLFSLLLGVIVAIACIAGSISIARHDPRLSLVLSGALFALSYWTGLYSYRMLNAHGDGFAMLGAFVIGSAVAIVAGVALVCALILISGALRSPARQFAPLVLLPILPLVGLQISQNHREHVEEARAHLALVLDYVRQHRNEIRYKEDCVRVPQEYQATCRDNLWPAPLPRIYTPDGNVDQAATRSRDREVGATWARVNHATRTSDCLTVWAERSESMDVLTGCRDYVSGR
jgi:hypothetical protein